MAEWLVTLCDVWIGIILIAFSLFVLGMLIVLFYGALKWIDAQIRSKW